MSKRRITLSLFALPALSLAPLVFAQQGQPIAGYQLLTTMTVPAGFRGNDISFVDSASARLYVADRGLATANPPINPALDVFDTENNRFLASIPLVSPSNGVVAVPRSHEVWVGLLDSTVAVINTDNYTITHVISTGGKLRADEVAYDPIDHIVMIANDNDTPPFVSFISSQSYSVIKKVNYDGTLAPNATNGIEQPVWNGVTGKFYIAIPATSANPNGEVDEFDPTSFKLTRTFVSTCVGPAGLALIPAQRLMDSCGDVIDIASGKVVTTVAGVHGDQIAYNAGDQRVYFGGGTDRITVNVVDANNYTVVTGLVVGQIAVAPATVSSTTHGVAADDFNSEVFVPVPGIMGFNGIQVWRNGSSITATPNPVPVTLGSNFGSATISWTAPNAQIIEVHVNNPAGPLFTRNGNRGSMTTGSWITDGTVFYLQDVSTGQALTSASTLGTVTVHLH